MFCVCNFLCMYSKFFVYVGLVCFLRVGNFFVCILFDFCLITKLHELPCIRYIFCLIAKFTTCFFYFGLNLLLQFVNCGGRCYGKLKHSNFWV